MQPEPQTSRYSLGDGIGLVVAFLLHGVALFFFVASGLLAPGWALLILYLVWGALLVFLILNRHRGLRVLLVPLADAVVWFALVQGLGTILDWRP